MMAKVILFGSSGRIGKCFIDILGQDCDIIAYSKAKGFNYGGKNIQLQDLLRDRSSSYVFADFSVDYSSIENMYKHEAEKAETFEKLLDKGLVKAYIGISSGASNFPSSSIVNNFYKEYSDSKRSKELYLDKVDIPVFYPKLFTLIGKYSYLRKSTGWVSILDQVRDNSVIEISDPGEQRTWISEDSLMRLMSQFLSQPSGRVFSDIRGGEFSLAEIVLIAERLFDKKVSIEIKKTSRWLLVPYVSDGDDVIDCQESLADVISGIVCNQSC